MANGEVTIGEVFRRCESLTVEIANLWRRIEALESGRKDDRHELRNALTEQLSNIHISVMSHAEKLGMLDERMASVSLIELAQKVGRLEVQISLASHVSGKGISIVVTAVVGLVMMLAGAWLSAKLSR